MKKGPVKFDLPQRFPEILPPEISIFHFWRNGMLSNLSGIFPYRAAKFFRAGKSAREEFRPEIEILKVFPRRLLAVKSVSFHGQITRQRTGENIVLHWKLRDHSQMKN